MEIIIGFFKTQGAKRITAILLVSLILVLLRDMLSMLLLTFIFGFIMFNIQSFIMSKTEKHIKLKSWATITVIYLILISSIILITVFYIPVLFDKSKELFHQLQAFYQGPHTSQVGNFVFSYLREKNLESYSERGLSIFYSVLRNAGKIAFNIIMAVVLSFFFLLEKNKISKFVKKFKDSKIAWLYNEIEYLGSKFAHSFGKMVQIRIVISIINCILVMIFLLFLGYPHLVGLGLLIFIAGLIPIVGAFIWLIPICVIGFIKGGLSYLAYLAVMAVALHILEGYILNPRLMSSGTELPLFFTFIILMLGEHFLGAWGLFIGIPIFIFALDLIDVDVTSKKSV